MYKDQNSQAFLNVSHCVKPHSIVLSLTGKVVICSRDIRFDPYAPKPCTAEGEETSMIALEKLKGPTVETKYS